MGATAVNGAEAAGLLPRSRGLRVTLATAASGIVASVVLLGYVPETQTLFYGLMGAFLAAYAVARGGAIVRVGAAYVTSRTAVWRWLFLAWAVLSLLWVGRSGTSFDRAVTLFEIYAVGLVMYDAGRYLGLAAPLLVVVFASGAIGVVWSFSRMSPFGTPRLAGIYGNPNMLAVTSLVALAAFHSGRAWSRGAARAAVGHLLALVLLGGIVATSSIKGVAGIACLWIVSAFLQGSRRRVVMQAGIAIVAGAVAMRFLDAFRAYWDRTVVRLHLMLVSLSSGAGGAISFVKRARFVRRGVELFEEAPVFGRGLGSFRWLSDEGTYAHNNYVDLGVALGVVGLVLYYGFYLVLLRRAWALENRNHDVARFVLVFVPLMFLVDLGAVSYYMKLPTLVALIAAGWLDRQVEGECCAG